MSNTLLQIKAAIYKKLGEAELNALEYDWNSIVKPRVNSVIKDISKGEYQSYLNPTITYRGGDMIFLRKTVDINNYEKDILSYNHVPGVLGYLTFKKNKLFGPGIKGYSPISGQGDVWSGVNITSKNGGLYIAGKLFKYSYINENVLSTTIVISNKSYVDVPSNINIVRLKYVTVNGTNQDYTLNLTNDNKRIEFNGNQTGTVVIKYVDNFTIGSGSAFNTIELKEGTVIKNLEVKPTDYYKQLELEYNFTNGEGKLYEYADFRYEKPYEYYTIIGDSVSGEYVIIENQNYGKHVLRYYGLPTDLSGDTDVCILPGNAGIDIVSTIVAGELLIETEEEKQGERLLNMAYTKLQMFYNSYGKLNKSSRDKIRYNGMNASHIFGNRR